MDLDSWVISFVDPIKESTLRAVKSAEELGVRMVMVTGDSGEVAAAVALEIGLTETSLKKLSLELSGRNLEQKEKEKALQEINVFYRVSPEQKFLIVSALQDRFMVGFLGEGINDAPALKMAGVSMVVDSAADIAREASDIILTLPGLEVIVEGISRRQEGIRQYYQIYQSYPDFQCWQFFCHRDRVFSYPFSAHAACTDSAREFTVRHPHDLDFIILLHTST